MDTKLLVISVILVASLLACLIYQQSLIVPYKSPSTTSSGPILSIENVHFNVQEQSKKIEITIRNSGNDKATIDAVDLGLNVSNLERQEDVYLGTVNSDSTLTITISNYDFEYGRMYYFTIWTDEGFAIPFSREYSSITFPFVESEQPQKTEPFPLTTVTAIILTIIGVSASLLIYFKKIRQ